MRRTVVVATLAAMLLVSAPADAHTKTWGTTHNVTVDYANNFVTGQVGSVKATCIGGRQVKVFRNGVQYGFTSITEPDGTWTNGAGDIQPGDDIRVVVPTRFLRRSSSHQHACKKVVVHFT